MTEKQALSVGQQVQFRYPRSDRRSWWTVRAADERFVILTRQAPFKPRGKLLYTIIDWERDLRGPCNLLGQGWDFNTDPVSDAEGLLRALTARLESEAWAKTVPAGTSRPLDEVEVEVSHRNNVHIEIHAVRNTSKAGS